MNENDPLTIRILERCKAGITETLRDADRHVMQVNQVSDTLNGRGELQETMLLGNIIYEPRDSNGKGKGRLLQAALGVGHGGVGVVLWNVDAYEQQIQSDSPNFAPDGVRFSPYVDCPVEIRQLLLPYLAPLIDRLIELVGE